MVRVVILGVALLFCTSALTPEELAMFKPRLLNYTDPNTDMEAEVYGEDNGDGSQTIYTNGIPSHETWIFPDSSSNNPNSIGENIVELKIYSEPIMRSNPMMCTPTGFVGIATSGTVIYNWYPAEEGCEDVKNFEELDICEGHPSPFSQYHYHYYSPCVQVPVCGEPSPIYGVALDGIPIYGPISEDGIQLTSDDLDECGGRVDRDGRYKYHVVADPTYFLACFKGEIRSDSGKEAELFTCTCPYDDTVFQRSANRVVLDPVCSADESDGSQPITCWDEEYLAELEYEIPYVWKKVEKEIDLIACCPPGSDCGTSCSTEDGVKDECHVETRTVNYLTRFDKDDSSSDSESDSSSDDQWYPDPDPERRPRPRPRPRPRW